jgi:2-dehydro-3-deoxygalactonokinase
LRAEVLLGERKREDAASFASGLLVGADVRIGVADAANAEIVVIGRPQLTELYRVALTEAGRSVREIDGEVAFLAGIRHIAEAMP